MVSHGECVEFFISGLCSFQGETVGFTFEGAKQESARRFLFLARIGTSFSRTHFYLPSAGSSALLLFGGSRRGYWDKRRAHSPNLLRHSHLRSPHFQLLQCPWRCRHREILGTLLVHLACRPSSQPLLELIQL